MNRIDAVYIEKRIQLICSTPHLKEHDDHSVEDSSDKNWPLSVQKAWPAMIMGASRMWLELVSESASRQSNISGIEAKYKKVQDDVTQIWRDKGQHAILHHLNGVYAYQPLLISY